MAVNGFTGRIRKVIGSFTFTFGNQDIVSPSGGGCSPRGGVQMALSPSGGGGVPVDREKINRKAHPNPSAGGAQGWGWGNGDLSPPGGLSPVDRIGQLLAASGVVRSKGGDSPLFSGSRT